jgi:type IV secretory pathway VirD2 relaxase
MESKSLSASSRRATVKVRLVYLKQARVRSTITHLRYIERESVAVNRTPARS